MSKSIIQIRQELEQASKEQRKSLLDAYQSDPRKGVQNLIEKYHKKELALQKEMLRLEQMHFFEKKYGAEYSLICGIDEAGRGPLAGPVVAGACILPPDATILYLNDSKKLSEQKREQLYDEICEKAITYSVGIVSPQRIDQINILQATYEAMRQAIANLSIKPELLLNDAVMIPGVDIKQVPIIKGDAKSISIGAASIMAKVYRDHMMEEYDKVFPGYDFASNKGYGSKEHIEALHRLGPCPIHRCSFLKNIL